jgi:hypothetical protein
LNSTGGLKFLVIPLIVTIVDRNCKLNTLPNKTSADSTIRIQAMFLQVSDFSAG